MKYAIGLGSNLGDRQAHLAQAMELLQQKVVIEKKAFCYENPAWVPQGIQEDWNKPFLNTALWIDTELEPQELLHFVKNIEKQMGRENQKKWSPRVIDLDILFCEERSCRQENLNLPHKSLKERPFVLAPLKDICAQKLIDGKNVLHWYRQLKVSIPLWMGIINVTPDSFSDGGQIQTQDDFLFQLNHFSQHNIQIVDMGAESTRPGAQPVDEEWEWKILKPYLETHRNFNVKKEKIALSVDTRHASVAENSIHIRLDSF